MSKLDLKKIKCGTTRAAIYEIQGSIRKILRTLDGRDKTNEIRKEVKCKEIWADRDGFYTDSPRPGAPGVTRMIEPTTQEQFLSEVVKIVNGDHRAMDFVDMAKRMGMIKKEDE